MEMNNGNIDLEQFKGIIDALSPCMDDYLYIYDLVNDLYCISPLAVERFLLPSSTFNDVNARLQELVHPDDWDMLSKDIAKVNNDENFIFHNLQYRWKDRQGKPIWINCRGRVIRDINNSPIYLVGCINEIGVKQRADNVSGLQGDVIFKEDIKTLIDADNGGFLLRLGIDNFKEINENRGLDYGDMILRKTAECIDECVKNGQKLYKLAADEFMILDYSGHGVFDAQTMYNKIVNRINKFIESNHYEVFFTVSAGIFDLAESENYDYYELMKLSEFALNKAKDNGKNRYYVYNESDYNAFRRKRRLINIMRQSVNQAFEGFNTYFQPIVDIKSGKLSHAETLLRFSGEEIGPVSPAEFIPLLEESGLIIPVGRWVAQQAIYACKYMQRYIPDFHVSFNLSYIQVLKSNVLSDILNLLQESGLKPGSLVVELTESGFVESDESFISFCEGLKMHGIPIALDDFGTGYSNFHYLYNLTPNIIKIDRSFTLKALKNDYEYNLLQHMSDMTHSIDSKFCIEGIETSEELERICHIKPDYIQGYYFGKPMPLEQFECKFVKDGKGCVEVRK